MRKCLVVLLFLAACTTESKKDHEVTKPVEQAKHDTIENPAVIVPKEPPAKPNDTLTAIAQLISGKADSSGLYPKIAANKHYKSFSESFSKRWTIFDTTRIVKLESFQKSTLHEKVSQEKTLFYPFSGPDILHASLFFPDAERYVLIALEPVGDLPDFEKTNPDSLQKYYKRLNTSLNAILNFSFFRTESMSKDLKNEEVDGSLHLLFLFLNRLGNQIVSAKPITIDSTGNIVYMNSFEQLKTSKLQTKGVEIKFLSKDGQLKTMEYYSLNAVDYALKKNKGFTNYLATINHFNTYLKGASYLLHKDYFSIIRNKILEGSSTIVQDDSGIALRYFEKETGKWEYSLYGEYTKPVSLFSKQYQKDLDSLYKKQGSSALGFGLGYNFKDKNSNLMIINRKTK
ncbi:MAG: hypothetical protein JNL60_08565 [Bacteroidia bacterium]|nr:hypothetical protein [Bacteroidia bacterium]